MKQPQKLFIIRQLVNCLGVYGIFIFIALNHLRLVGGDSGTHFLVFVISFLLSWDCLKSLPNSAIPIATKIHIIDFYLVGWVTVVFVSFVAMLSDSFVFSPEFAGKSNTEEIILRTLLAGNYIICTWRAWNYLSVSIKDRKLFQSSTKLNVA